MCSSDLTALEIRSTRASDQQAVAGKRHGLVVEYECDASIGMTRRGAYGQVPCAELDLVAVAQIAVRAFGAARGRDRNPATCTAVQHPCTGHVIGVDVSVDGVKQMQSKLFDQGAIPAHLFEYRIDQHGLSRRAIGKKIRVG